MKVTLELDDDLADRVFEVAGNRRQRINDAVLEIVREAVMPADPLVPLLDEVRSAVVPRSLSAEREWNPTEVEHFEAQVRQMWSEGATDRDMSVETGAVRERIARTRRRLGLPANPGRR